MVLSWSRTGVVQPKINTVRDHESTVTSKLWDTALGFLHNIHLNKYFKKGQLQESLKMIKIIKNFDFHVILLMFVFSTIFELISETGKPTANRLFLGYREWKNNIRYLFAKKIKSAHFSAILKKRPRKRVTRHRSRL